MIDADPSVDGDQAFVFSGTGAFSGVGQLRLYDVGTFTMIAVTVDADLDPEMVVQVTDGTALASDWAEADFIL